MRTRFLASIAVVVLSLAGYARAQPAPEPSAAPAGGETETVSTAPASARPGGVVYGAGLRGAWVSVPGWFLDLFTKQNVPLSSYGIGGEFFRRKGEMDILFSIGYQRMGPPDGNWLGKGEQAGLETDLLQFRNFALIGVDASFIWRSVLNQYVALRYGAGLGLAVVTGDMLRVSAAGCTDANVGDTSACKPLYCRGASCTEAEHVANQGGVDGGPGNPHRFSEDDVPPAVPILNIVLGADFHIPNVQNVEFRLEGGFHNAFFIGLAGSYLF
jgi:hypothetical protein